MNTPEIANRLVELCRKGRYETAQKELYADTCVSIEPDNAPNPRVEGITAILKKSKAFDDMVEMHYSYQVSDPIIAQNFFSFALILDADFKGVGRVYMEEICVFEVADGKIVKEQFFYTPTA